MAYFRSRFPGVSALFVATLLLVFLPALGCQPTPQDATGETTEARTTVEWRFDEAQPDWKPVVTMNPNTRPVKVERTDDALRLMLDESGNNLDGDPRGGIVIDLPQWNGWAWGSILVRARASEGIQGFDVAFNTVPGEPGTSRSPNPYEFINRHWPDAVPCRPICCHRSGSRVGVVSHVRRRLKLSLSCPCESVNRSKPRKPRNNANPHPPWRFR